MIAYTTARPVRTRLRRMAVIVSLAAAAVLPMASCSPTEFLEVTDPDIIPPEETQSAVGAQGVRVGALARLNTATSGFPSGGSESLLLLGGLFADEWINGDSFIARQEVDQRVITPENTFLTTANRWLHRARLSAEQAVDLLTEFDPAAPAWQVAEMHFVQAYVANILAEHYCDGIVFSTLVDGIEQYGSPISYMAAFERALGHADDGLALTLGTTADDLRVRRALQLIRGRILLNLDRVDEAAAAVATVPTNYRYTMRHSETTNINAFWQFNNNSRRYSVSNSEGTNGLNFATAGDPRVPVCVGNDAACRAIGVTTRRRDDQVEPVHVQMIWRTRTDSVAIVNGIEARLIEAEAQLAAGNPDSARAILNAARTTVTGLAPLVDAGTDDARVDQLFRERAFWLFGRGHRVGDLRRLIRQYGRPENTVFPVGQWHKGGNYGTDVNVPNPQAELNNPNVTQACMTRDA
jgi:starch-binding outer membrane protein, SusD/RagB family